MSTIATLAVGLVSNAAGFTAGMNAARGSTDLFAGSLRSARGIFDATRTPAERYATQVETLNKHFRAGKIDAETYSRALESVNEGYKRATGRESMGFGEAAKGILETVAAIELAHKAVEEIKGSIESAAATSHLAETIGVSAEELGRLQYAAKMTETPIDAITNSIGKLQKQLGQIDLTGDEGKGLAATLKALNLEAGTLASESPTEALGEIADALNRVESPTMRSTYAMALFGKGGRELLPFLKEGSRGMNELGEEAKRLNVALDSEQMEKMEAANRSLIRANEAFRGGVNQVTVALAPYIAQLANLVTEHQKGVVATAAGVAGIGSLTLAYNVARPAVTDLIGLVSKLGLTWTEAGVAGAAFAAIAGVAIVGTMNDTSASVAKAKDSFDGMLEAAGTAEAKILTLGMANDAINRSADRHYAALDVKDTQKAWEELGREMDHVFAEQSGASSIRSKIDLQKELIADQERGVALMEHVTRIEGAGDPGALAKRAEEARDWLHELQDQLKEMQKGLQGPTAPVDKKAIKWIERLSDRLREAQAAAQGLGEVQKIMDDFARAAPNATPEQTNTVQNMAEQIKAAEEMKKQIDHARQLADQGRSPLEVYKSNLADLDTALRSSAITWEQYANGVRKANDEVARAARAGKDAAGVYQASNIRLHSDRMPEIKRPQFSLGSMPQAPFVPVGDPQALIDLANKAAAAGAAARHQDTATERRARLGPSGTGREYGPNASANEPILKDIRSLLQDIKGGVGLGLVN